MSALPHALYRWSWPLLLAVLATACARERDRSAEVRALIEETVSERLATYRRVRLERCREDILEEANRRVDSIMIWEATLERGSKPKPPRPNRPAPPPLRPYEDTIPLAPLLPTDTLPPPDTTESGPG